MDDSRDVRNASSADDILKEYRERLSRIQGDSPDADVQDPFQEKLHQNLAVLKNEFQGTLSSLEDRVAAQYREYQVIFKKVTALKKELEVTYGVKATLENMDRQIKTHQGRLDALELEYCEYHDTLKLKYETKKQRIEQELNTQLSVADKEYTQQKKYFEDEIKQLDQIFLDKQVQLDRELERKEKEALEALRHKENERIQELEDSLQHLKDEKLQLEKHIVESQFAWDKERETFQQEMDQKRYEWKQEGIQFQKDTVSKMAAWESEETALKERIAKKRLEWEKEAEDIRLRLDKDKEDWAKEQDSLTAEQEIVRSTWEDTEKVFHEKNAKRLSEWKAEELAFEERKKQWLEEESAIKLQNQINRDLETRDIESQRRKFDEELASKRLAFEASIKEEKEQLKQQLLEQRDSMLETYRQTRDSEVDKLFLVEKKHLEDKITSLNSKLRVMESDMSSVLDGNHPVFDQKNQEIKQLESQISTFESDLAQGVNRAINETKLSEASKLEARLKEAEQKFDHERQQLIKGRNLLEEKVKLREQELTDVKTQLKRAETQINRIVVTSVEKTDASKVVPKDKLPKVVRINRRM